jgi:hypothetical protein
MATVERTNCTLFWWLARFSAFWTLSGLVGLILFSRHFVTPLNVSVLVAVMLRCGLRYGATLV